MKAITLIFILSWTALLFAQDQAPQAPEGAKSAESLSENFTYDPTGKRDPFIPEIPKTEITTPVEVATSPETAAPEEPGPDHPLEPLEAYDLSQLKLTAIIWNTKNPRAMLSDPIGRTHYVKVKSRVGRRNGFVVSIREGEMVVVEYIWENSQYSKVFKVMELR